MIGNRFLVNVLLVSSLLTGVSSAIARDAEQQSTPQLVLASGIEGLISAHAVRGFPA
jgi:hypothetical protein